MKAQKLLLLMGIFFIVEFSFAMNKEELQNSPEYNLFLEKITDIAEKKMLKPDALERFFFVLKKFLFDVEKVEIKNENDCFYVKQCINSGWKLIKRSRSECFDYEFVKKVISNKKLGTILIKRQTFEQMMMPPQNVRLIPVQLLT